MNNILIGESDFKIIREANGYYVDKSLFIEEVLKCPNKVILLPRPRRFGKTINISMLRYFFEKKDQDESHLFDGLVIKESSVFQEHFSKYPVIFMTFKDVKHSIWENCLEDIQLTIASAFEYHWYLLESDVLRDIEKERFNKIIKGDASEVLYSKGLQFLSEYLCRYHKKPAMIFIDEYDTPIHAGYNHNYYKEIVPFMRNFLSGGFKDNSNLSRGVITGTLRISKESIFTGLNNLGVFTLLKKRFNNCFGFTKTEVEKILTDFDLFNYYPTIAKWYDGYKFGGKKVFNPWSVMNFVSDSEEKPESYWLNTSSMEMIEEVVLGKPQEQKQILRNELMELIQDRYIEKNIDDNIIIQDLKKANSEAVWSFLLHSGYLKAIERIDDEFENIYKLQIPNMEVKIAYRKLVQKWFTETVNLEELNIMLQALKNGNIRLFEKHLKAVSMVIMSYHDFSGSPEKVYHALVLGMLVWLSNDYVIRSNRESGIGRYDIIFKPKDTNKQGIIIEFKQIYEGEDSDEVLNKALKQIDEKKYDIELKAAGVNDMLKIAVGFTGKEVYLKKGS
ncbi:9-O-acetyl-N-acetylneuraminate esterase [Candidatus Magnetomoraceae bacterium gMMP-1]